MGTKKKTTEVKPLFAAKTIRLMLGISRAQIARWAHVSMPTVDAFERANGNLGTTERSDVARASLARVYEALHTLEASTRQETAS